ncbi:MAG: hypothetical protein OHK0029_11070 [Armatimonadaceae bacterium]
MQLGMFNRARYYVSLGDSISIDAYAGGPGRGAASLLLKNRNEDFPDWQGRDLSSALPGARLIPLAMDGATSATVRYAQIPRLKEMNIRPEIITLTIGGNDLVQTFGADDLTEDTLNHLRSNLTATLDSLRQIAGDEAPILLGTIYDPSDGTGNAGELNISVWPTALEWLERFNDTLKIAAQTHDCLLADIHQHFLGHGATVGSPSQSDSRPANRDLWFCGTIEPNAWGASEVRRVWWETLQAAGKL